MKRKLIAVTSASVIGLTAIAGFVTLITTSAHAQAIPKLPAEQLCRATSNPSINPFVATGDAEAAFAQCLQSERTYRKELEKQWGNFSQADKQHCVSLAQMGGGSASYAELLTCLEMAHDVRQSKSSSASPEGKEYRKRVR